MQIRPVQSKLNSSKFAQNHMANEEFTFQFSNSNYCVMPQKSYEQIQFRLSFVFDFPGKLYLQNHVWWFQAYML